MNEKLINIQQLQVKLRTDLVQTSKQKRAKHNHSWNTYDTQQPNRRQSIINEYGASESPYTKKLSVVAVPAQPDVNRKVERSIDFSKLQNQMHNAIAITHRHSPTLHKNCQSIQSLLSHGRGSSTNILTPAEPKKDRRAAHYRNSNQSCQLTLPSCKEYTAGGKKSMQVYSTEQTTPVVTRMTLKEFSEQVKNRNCLAIERQCEHKVARERLGSANSNPDGQVDPLIRSQLPKFKRMMRVNYEKLVRENKTKLAGAAAGAHQRVTVRFSNNKEGRRSKKSLGGFDKL